MSDYTWQAFFTGCNLEEVLRNPDPTDTPLAAGKEENAMEPHIIIILMTAVTTLLAWRA